MKSNLSKQKKKNYKHVENNSSTLFIQLVSGIETVKMVVTCEIDFDNNKNGTYFAGQMLTGTIILKSDKPKEVKGMIKPKINV